MKKIRVFLLSCNHTDLGPLYCFSTEELQQHLEADHTQVSDNEAQDCQYFIDIKMMTQAEIDALPEYEA